MARAENVLGPFAAAVWSPPLPRAHSMDPTLAELIAIREGTAVPRCTRLSRVVWELLESRA
eukprot:CAMPEP_0119341880 /NCGR_PEP_ID=MMETSP1333-20130426/103547_1 /TAXON_ID=418940 /ORGANISM="Scyphosphaera apsteinii, Strain RCC1455" /LENGTH=60 /DNA_ID=CAMNT_0007353969 /DNA_START=179 /DNA_END=357 /DNA_ORIENTATION=+